MPNVDELSAISAAELLAQSVADIVGGALRSVVLHGSLTTGGFRSGRSDIDVIAIVDGGLTDAQATALERLVRQADAGTAAGIDLHIVTSEVAAAPIREPALELHIGRYDRSSIEVEVERQLASCPDLLAELSMARADGRALRGAAPGDVITPVPTDWIVARGRHWLRKWQSLTDDAENAAFMVLTACRIWHFAIENAHCSKVRAARWALGRRPHLIAIRQAVQQYEQDPASVIGQDGIAELLDRVLDETAPAR